MDKEQLNDWIRRLHELEKEIGTAGVTNASLRELYPSLRKQLSAIRGTLQNYQQRL